MRGGRVTRALANRSQQSHLLQDEPVHAQGGELANTLVRAHIPREEEIGSAGEFAGDLGRGRPESGLRECRAERAAAPMREHRHEAARHRDHGECRLHTQGEREGRGR